MTGKIPHADPVVTPEVVKQHGLTPEEFERIAERGGAVVLKHED